CSVFLASLAATMAMPAVPTAHTHAQATPTPQCSLNRVPMTATVDRAHPVRRFEVHFDRACAPTVTEIPVTSPPEPSAAGPGTKAATATAPTRPAGSSDFAPMDVSPSDVLQYAGTNTCVAIQTLRDPLGIPETEFRNKQTWTWDGVNVDSASVYVESVPGKTGWVAVTPTATYYGQYLPANGIEAFGYGQFYFYNPSVYNHTHEVDTLVEGNGSCSGEWYLSGTVPGDGSYITRDFYIQ